MQLKLPYSLGSRWCRNVYGRYMTTQSGNELPVVFEDVVKAMYRIRGGVLNTSCWKSPKLSSLLDCNLYLKKDYRQMSGSFKERGARNTLLQLSSEEMRKGVIAASAGNHALALAYHGKELGIPVTCVMPKVAPLTKVNNCRKLGARVIIHGDHLLEAKETAMELVEKEGFRYINGYDDPEIIAGAGTMALEFLDQVKDVDVVVVPCGGGGLVSGIGLVVKALRPEARVIAVEPTAMPSLTCALEAGKPVEAIQAEATLADGLAVSMVGSNAFEISRQVVDEVVTVEERDIALGVLRCLEEEAVVVEGSGSAGVAALLPGAPLDRPDMKGKNIIVPLCGSNIDTTTLGRVIERGMAADGRLVQFTVTVSDRPGGVAQLAQCLAETGVCVKDIYHERAWLYSDIAAVSVKCVVETGGHEHTDTLKTALLEKGYTVDWEGNNKQQARAGKESFYFEVDQ